MVMAKMEMLINDNNIKKIKENSIVEGIIIEIKKNEIIVDLGSKSEGIIPISEFNNINEFNINDKIEIFIEKIEDKNGNPILSYEKALYKKNWDKILAEENVGSIVKGVAKSKVKGGLILNIGVEAFLPSSQIDIQPPQDLDKYLGQVFECKILKINQDKKNIIVSRREIIEEERNEKKQVLLDQVKVGDKCFGIVKNITDYGAFIDLNGLDGLLYITDMTWGRISHPSEILHLGKEIEVIILSIDYNKKRLSLGLKQIKENPWENIETKYPLGSKVTGKVVNIVPYGAFIELEKGIEGLVHITEFSWSKRINKPEDFLKVGDNIESIILSIQKDEEKISLGIKQIDKNPWNMVEHNYPIGAKVKGKVSNMTQYGVFIELEEGFDGMVHISDISWTRKINHPSEVLSKDEEVEAIVLDINKKENKISLGIKQLYNDPWKSINEDFKIGDIVTGKISNITPYGAFVRLKQDIDGLVHISQVSEERIEKIKDVLSLDQEVTARVIKIDSQERRIGLSIKAANYDNKQLEEEIKFYSNLKNEENQLASLGEILDKAKK